MKLTPSDNRVYDLLKKWNPNKDGVANFFSISVKLDQSESSVTKSLRRLRELGYIEKSSGGAWHV